MPEEKKVAEDQSPGETNLSVKTLVSNKGFILQLKLIAPRDHFRHFEALSFFGGFPSVEDYIRANFHKLIDEYCTEAAERLTVAGRPDFLSAKRKANNS